VTGDDIIAAAEKYTGVPYSQSNPADPYAGLDCSSIVQRALGDLGTKISRTTGSQLADAGAANIGTDIGLARPGDILHYDGHEEIWLGNGKVFSEADYGTTAAIRNRTPETIVGIVRYGQPGTGGPTTGNAAYNAAPADNPLSKLNPFNGVGEFVAKSGVKLGLILGGGLVVALGFLVMFPQATKAAEGKAKQGAEMAAMA